MQVFFTEKQLKPHLARYANRVEKVLGKPAVIPAWPGVEFFYREESGGPNRGSILTEARSGCLVAEAQSRAQLHAVLRLLVRKYNEKALKRQVAKWPPCPKPDFYIY